MKDIPPSELRNFAVIGHSASGKTSLCEALLFTAGAIKHLGTVEAGTTVMDFEPEENERHKSFSAGIASLDWKGHGLHIVDTPGDSNFIAEAKSCLQVLDGAVLVISAVGGVEPQTEKAWSFTRECNTPVLGFVNMMDRENANFEKAIASVQEGLGVKAVPLQIPIGSGDAFRGVIDLASMKALVYAGDGSSKFKEEEIPGDLKEAAESARKEL
ncbi:MAG: GTP-binding protein, partial [Myxococcota bacterium]